MLTMKRVLMTATVLTPFAFVASAAQADIPEKDGAYVAVDGTVGATNLEGFELEHDDGSIFVEFDDFDFSQADDQIPVVEGDPVTVYGYVDDDAFELRTIEATSVYVDSLNATYYASGLDEENIDVTYVFPWSVAGRDDITLSGEVNSINDREFWLRTAAGGLVEVDTAAMAFNPLDDTGFTQVNVGDTVTVSGSMDDAVFDNRELSANSVIVTDYADQS